MREYDCVYNYAILAPMRFHAISKYIKVVIFHQVMIFMYLIVTDA